MKNICIIGFGNIGKRHFESLLKNGEDIEVFLIDNDLLMFQNYEGLEKVNFKVLYGNDYNILPNKIDVAIIATSSAVRRICFEELINHTMVKNIIFEKFLFQKIEDYYFVKNKLKEKEIKAWVDVGRRETQYYIDLKERLKDEKDLIFNIYGGNWGLCCNGIHMFDLISFLSGIRNLNIDNAVFSKNIIDSKRQGYKEMYGALVGTGNEDDKRVSFNISCFDSNMPRYIEIITSQNVYDIREFDHKYIVYDKDEKIIEQNDNQKFEMISEISYKCVKGILERGNCNLVSYEDSMDLHIKIMKAIEKFLYNEEGDDKICPIT